MNMLHKRSGPSLHFENVGLQLGGNQILEDIDFYVDPGTIHCIIGPNGGGKTSLVRCLLGQMPHSGTIRICRADTLTIGYVPQSLAFDDTLPLTVSDFMAMAGKQRRPAFWGMGRDYKAEVMRALNKVGMQTKAGHQFGSLSGGERQRVLLAQALLPAPQLLLLDEPATGLDKAGSAIMHAIIDELSRSGTTVVMIHHDLGVVREVAHTVTCINRSMRFSGPPAEELTADRVFSIFSSEAKAA